MTTSTHFARVITSFMMLCIATSAFAQNRPNLTKDSGQPVGAEKLESSAKCPVIGGTQRATSERHTAAGVLSNGDWWPNQLNLQILHQNSPKSNPLGGNFNYAA